MRYMVAKWRHRSTHYPRWIVVELAEDRYEKRKVEVFPEGDIGYAGSDEEVGRTRLADEPWPALEQLRTNPEFQVDEIDQELFGEVWEKRHDSTDRFWHDWPQILLGRCHDTCSGSG